MTDPIVNEAEATAKTLGQKALAWLKVFWYQFLIGVGVGALLAHMFWK